MFFKYKMDYYSKIQFLFSDATKTNSQYLKTNGLVILLAVIAGSILKINIFFVMVFSIIGLIFVNLIPFLKEGTKKLYKPYYEQMEGLIEKDIPLGITLEKNYFQIVGLFFTENKRYNGKNLVTDTYYFVSRKIYYTDILAYNESSQSFIFKDKFKDIKEEITLANFFDDFKEINELINHEFNEIQENIEYSKS